MSGTPSAKLYSLFDIWSFKKFEAIVPLRNIIWMPS